ncbi:MAG: hypothetical protein EXQ89_01480 [Rhodospirillaceae bacterium]|nr:hypothetical protein [Rhodospirillaceae bacterium]
MEVMPWEIWVRATWLSQYVRANGWLWPVLETFHYIGLSLLIGTVGLFDLRVLGVAKALPPLALHRLIPLGVAGYVLNLITGLCFISAFADQYAYNSAFHIKLALMAVAGINLVIFYSSAFGELKTLGAGASAPWRCKVLVGVSLFSWVGVLICGRLLTFFRPGTFH